MWVSPTQDMLAAQPGGGGIILEATRPKMLQLKGGEGRPE